MQKIVPADELLCHQTPETFATVSQADISWTEKLWSSLFARDGSLQVDVGIGKYHNRNVIDMFAGISRGKEQLTVRASRQLDSDPERVGVGPLDYEVIEPLKRSAAVLRENHVLPIRFDLTDPRRAAPVPGGQGRTAGAVRLPHLLGPAALPPGLDDQRPDLDRRRGRSRSGTRSGSASATTPGGCGWTSATRRPTCTGPTASTQDFMLTWSPMYLRRPDGSQLRDPPLPAVGGRRGDLLLRIR